MSKYLVHWVQYLRPSRYGLGDGKQGYARFSHRFLQGGMNSELKKACYNEASTTGRGSITCFHIDYASALPEVAKLYLHEPVKSLIALLLLAKIWTPAN